MVCREIELYGGFVEEVQTELNHNKDNQSYVGSYLRERAESGTTDAPGIGLTNDGWMRNDMLAYVAGTMVEAGADTTSVTLQTVILQLLGNAAALRKAREEIDREIGPHRMPNFDDEARLPYVVACIKESLRCRPPVPLVRYYYPTWSLQVIHPVLKGSSALSRRGRYLGWVFDSQRFDRRRQHLGYSHGSDPLS